MMPKKTVAQPTPTLDQTNSPSEQPLIISERLNGQVTMYSSEVGQTDDTPFITANGDTVGQGTIACPIRYKFGTIVEIQGIRYKCNDRMHERYRQGNYFDVWVPETQQAINLGRKNVEIIIYQKQNSYDNIQGTPK